MGKRGPAPKPTALKRLTGVEPYRINDSEPIPDEKPVEAPVGLSEAERELWDRYVPDMVRKGVMRYWDEQKFARICVDTVVYWTAVADVRERGLWVRELERELADGTPVLKTIKNPAQQIANEASERLNKMGASFGMSPSDRAQLTIDPPRVAGPEGWRDPGRFFTGESSRQASQAEIDAYVSKMGA